MTDLQQDGTQQNAISASWQRCMYVHKLKRNAAQPILRLQASEVSPRLKEMTTLSGGRLGIFRQLAKLASDAEHCLVITDGEGIVVRLEHKNASQTWNGIALGSVWDERIAGTNGVSMALSEGCGFMVRGKEHYYSELKPFACSAIPLRDAFNKIIGVANLSSIDRGNPADALFAEQVLGAAAHRLQHTLFEKEFKEAAIVSIAVPGRRELIKGAELVAVDENGTILGATTAAHELSDLESHAELTGRKINDVFGTDLSALDRVPGRVMSVCRDSGPMLDLWTRTPVDRTNALPGWRPKPRQPERSRRQPTFKDLSVGSPTMATICERVKTSLEHGVPLLIEGETGTGKSVLISALLGASDQVVTIDCAALEDAADDRGYFRSLMQQARIANSIETDAPHRPVIVFDNLDELPGFAQPALRSLLSELENSFDHKASYSQIIGTTRHPLNSKVQSGTFRDDLYYMLTGAFVTLPPIRMREQLAAFAKTLACDLAGHDIILTPEAQKIIDAYDWPGNIRELQSSLKQALMYGDGARITGLDMSPVGKSAVQLKQTTTRPALYDEESLILDALHGARWNVSKAARSLSIGRATIHRKMKKLGIVRPT